MEKRDVKGFYVRARRGEILHFTGSPSNPEVVCYTDKETIEESIDKVISFLENNGSWYWTPFKFEIIRF